MKKWNCNRIMLVCSIGLLYVARTHAADINGAWAAKDKSACSKIFEKIDNKIKIFGRGGYIIEGDEIRGKSDTCNIKARKDDKQFVRLLVECSADIAENQLTLRIDGINKLTRIFPGMPEMNVAYFRCEQ